MTGIFGGLFGSFLGSGLSGLIGGGGLFSLLIMYLAPPLISFLSSYLLVILAKKNAILSKRKLIVFLLATCLMLALPSMIFGAIDLWFLPVYYIIAQLMYVGLGILYVNYLKKNFREEFGDKVLFEGLATFSILVFSWFLFSLGFNFMGDLKYGFYAGTCIFPFCIPLVFYWTYFAFITIPDAIYKIWYYPRNNEEIQLEGVDYMKLKMFEIEIRKNPSNNISTFVKARAPEDIVFGLWFQKFIDDYNYRFPNDPIQYSDKTGKEFGWIFYIKPSFFRFRRYIDFDVSIRENKLSENYTLVAKRVEEQ